MQIGVSHQQHQENCFALDSKRVDKKVMLRNDECLSTNAQCIGYALSFQQLLSFYQLHSDEAYVEPLECSLFLGHFRPAMVNHANRQLQEIGHTQYLP